MEFALVIILLACAAALISAPLWRPVAAEDAEAADVTALEVAKSAKLGEIRDAELDFRVGKLSAADYRELDRQLRGEAVDLLHQLDATREANGGGPSR